MGRAKYPVALSRQIPVIHDGQGPAIVRAGIHIAANFIALADDKSSKQGLILSKAEAARARVRQVFDGAEPYPRFGRSRIPELRRPHPRRPRLALKAVT